MLPIFGVLILSYSTWVHASYMDDIVTILNSSSSGKTILVDRGSAHEYNPKDYGILLAKDFYKDPDTGQEREVFKPVAKLKLVKLFRNNSIWVAIRAYLPEMMVKNKKLILLSESKLLTGRAELTMKRSKIVGHKEKLIDTVKDNIREDGLNLAKKEDDYFVARDVHPKEKHYDRDIELIDIDAWEDRAQSGKYSQTAIFQSPHSEVFSDRKRVATFEKMAYEFLRKYNDPKFTLKRLYYNQEKSDFNPTFREKTLTSTAFDRYAYEENNRLQREKILVKDLRSRGEVWSDGYSDAELSELLYNVNSVSELDRRKEISSYHFNYQVFLSTGLNVLNNDSGSEPRNTQSLKADVEGSIEGYFFKRIQSLNQVTLEFSFRRSQDSFDIGTTSAISTEYSAAAHVNWYPFRLPNVLEANIFYIGLLARTGLSDLSIPTEDEKGNYQVYTLPGIRGGIKYNFSNSYGLRLTLGAENIRVERIVRNEAAGDLPDRANYLEYKLSVGLSKFF